MWMTNLHLYVCLIFQLYNCRPETLRFETEAYEVVDWARDRAWDRDFGGKVLRSTQKLVL